MADEPEIIHLPNILKAKAPFGPDGVSQELLDKAEAVVANLQASYLDWVLNDLSKIQELYEQAKALPEDQRASAMKPLFSIAHDIKGQGGSFGYQLMTILGSQVCRFIEACQSFGDPELEVIRLHIDAMRLVISKNMEGEGGVVGAGLVRGLQAVIAKVRG